MVTQAFDSVKDISVQWGSLDRKDAENGPAVPYLMAKFGAAWDKADYYYLDGSNRLAFKDDWSALNDWTQGSMFNNAGVPIASS